MASVTSTFVRPGRRHRHIKALEAIRTRRETEKQKVYIPQRESVQLNERNLYEQK